MESCTCRPYLLSSLSLWLCRKYPTYEVKSLGKKGASFGSWAVITVEFLRALGSQGRGSSSIALLSCSADVLIILCTQYLYLGVLRLHIGLGMR